MSAIAAAASSLNVSAEEEARKDLLTLVQKFPISFRRPERCKDYATFVACCGSTVLDENAKWNSQNLGMKVSINPSDDEVLGYFNPLYRSPASPHARYFIQRSEEEFREMMLTNPDYGPALKKRWNRPGVFLGVGLSKNDLVNKAWDPAGELYGKVEALEFNDPDDGLVTLAWTNA